MRFSLASTIFGLLAVTAAQDVPFDPIYTPSAFQEVPVGTIFTITWDPQPAQYDNEPVRLYLIGGDTQATQVPLYDIANGVINSAGKFDWNVPVGESGKNFYGIVIMLESNDAIFQFSNPFKVVAALVDVSNTTSISTLSTTTSISTSAPLSTSTDLGVTTVISLSSVAATTTSSTDTETITIVAAAESVPTHSYAPVPDTHNNGTVSLTTPATTLSGITVAHTGPSHVPTSAPISILTSDGISRGVSVVVTAVVALLAIVF